MVWLLLLLLPVPGLAQTKTGPQRWPIERLTVEGLKNYSLQQALAATGLKTGQLAGRPDFEAARDRLLATGVFDTVGYRFAPSSGSNGYEASFQVVEGEPGHPVRFESLNEADAAGEACLGKKDPLF